jgi:hypothetical protein
LTNEAGRGLEICELKEAAGLFLEENVTGDRQQFQPIQKELFLSGDEHFLGGN